MSASEEKEYHLREKEEDVVSTSDEKDYKQKNETFVEKFSVWRKNMIWRYFCFITLWHVIGFYGFITFPYSTHKLTTLWIVIVYLYAVFGLCGGAHRYWSHRSFKAKLPLQIILAGGHYTVGILRIYDWVKIHRVHHKYTDMDADPHNASRGFFYAHIGWWVQKKNPEFLKRLKEIDMSDVKADPVANFGDKYYYSMLTLMTVILPSLVPIFLWNESFYWAILSQAFMRYVLALNSILLINSAAHMFGSKPFNRYIMPSENRLVVLLTTGEGWHNFHHTFPWDFRAGGIDKYDFNLTSFLIKQFEKIGWAYDLKTASNDLIKATSIKRGDGSHTKLWEEVPEPK
ncbi:acyl-CoA Delta(11) desaturase-like [Leptopilina heterotoma]|uniref:acyl-CoA Delta(11) desaturase-like n=1 Tax=Leptopilina heterotoma TaxID=63436 RepID=UPI001CA8E9FC|nr:acyl-CoA Delta(11) desaturase-like [Leptopilina heterotoma]